MSAELPSTPRPPMPPPDATPRPVPPVQGLAPGAVIDWLRWGAAELAGASESARADADVLLAALIDIDRSQLARRHDDPIEAATVLRYASMIERRKLGEPVAYITGRQGFWTLDLAVDTAVLIPRADTETLVEWALATLRTRIVAPPPRVLDLGTGSGAIALAIASEWGDADVTATDRSTAALDVARENARLLGLRQVTFHDGSWFGALPPGVARFDLIVSNPPYIAEGDAHLAALRYEPRLALTSGPDGLDAIRAITAAAPSFLMPGGWLLLEHGHDQGAAVRELLSAAGFTDVATRQDLGGHDRVSGGRCP